MVGPETEKRPASFPHHFSFGERDIMSKATGAHRLNHDVKERIRALSPRFNGEILKPQSIDLLCEELRAEFPGQEISPPAVRGVLTKILSSGAKPQSQSPAHKRRRSR